MVNCLLGKMHFSSAILLFFLGVPYCFCKGTLYFMPHTNNRVDPPSWPPYYEVYGILQLPYAEIKEPFYAFFDEKNNRSRVDYYHKTVLTYQFAGQKKNCVNETCGATYKVAPMFMNGKQQTGCFLVNGTNTSVVETQAVLPDLSGFKLLSDNGSCGPLLNGRQCQVWSNVTIIGSKKNTYTMRIDGSGIPVRYEMIGYDTLLGSHYDRYYLDYLNFTKGKGSDKPFNIDSGLNCTSFPGPGVEHRVTMNPMGEYIGRDDSHVNEMFNHFKKRHNKKYQNNHEEQSRVHQFRHNVRFIHSKNRAGLSYTLAVNHLADMTDKERSVMRGRLYTPGYNGGLPFNKFKYDLRNLPDQLDWRLYGAVTPVKDQAVCGSCWSFGTTGTIEGAYFLKYGQQVRLSQQELMDCSWEEGNNACDGGEDFRAYQWIMKNGGLSTEEGYGAGAYLAQDSYCYAANASKTAQIASYVNVTTGDAEALRAALIHHGPVSVGIDASHTSLSFYANGVYYEPKCGKKPDELDHAVLAVGYGVINGQSYWLIKNSWSTYWGNNGYVLMAQRENNCGVTTAATFVNLK